MSISLNWASKTVLSTASITDLPAFKETLRDLEASATGILYPAIITYKKLDLGGGGYFHGVDLINGYVLQFVGAGPFTINGNLGATLVDTGVQIERKTSAAFATTATEGGAEAADPLDSLVEGSITARQALRVLLAEAAGTTLGLNSTHPRFKNVAGDKTRVDATLDADGDRTSVTLDLT